MLEPQQPPESRDCFLDANPALMARAVLLSAGIVPTKTVAMYKITVE
ncbi:MAG: hypothetical protein RML75_01775 [Cyanobacteriota bacterium SKYGB_h_bin112]|nr:hypothetical protein [Cyanobacteriota bacterium SKYGB_h_bin112]